VRAVMVAGRGCRGRRSRCVSTRCRRRGVGGEGKWGTPKTQMRLLRKQSGTDEERADVPPLLRQNQSRFSGAAIMAPGVYRYIARIPALAADRRRTLSIRVRFPERRESDDPLLPARHGLNIGSSVLQERGAERRQPPLPGTLALCHEDHRRAHDQTCWVRAIASWPSTDGDGSTRCRWRGPHRPVEAKLIRSGRLHAHSGCARSDCPKDYNPPTPRQAWHAVEFDLFFVRRQWCPTRAEPTTACSSPNALILARGALAPAANSGARGSTPRASGGRIRAEHRANLAASRRQGTTS